MSQVSAASNSAIRRARPNDLTRDRMQHGAGGAYARARVCSCKTKLKACELSCIHALQDCQGKKEDLIRLEIDSCMYVSITAVYYVFCDGSPAEQGGWPVAAEFEESMPLRRSVVHCVAVRGQDARTGERLCSCAEPETRDMRKLKEKTIGWQPWFAYAKRK